MYILAQLVSLTPFLLSRRRWSCYCSGYKLTSLIEFSDISFRLYYQNVRTTSLKSIYRTLNARPKNLSSTPNDLSSTPKEPLRPIMKRDFYFRFPRIDAGSGLALDPSEREGVITLIVCYNAKDQKNPKWFGRNFRYVVDIYGNGVLHELKTEDGRTIVKERDSPRGSVHALWIGLKRLHSVKRMVSCGMVNTSIPIIDVSGGAGGAGGADVSETTRDMTYMVTRTSMFTKA